MSKIQLGAAALAPDAFVSLIDNSDDFIAFASLDGRVAYVNAAGGKLVGADARDLGGAAIEDLFWREDGTFIRDVVLRGVRDDGRWNGEVRLRRNSVATFVPADCSIYFTTDPVTRERSAIAVVARDISARRRAERRMRGLVDAGATLSHSLESVQTLRNLCELIVDVLATFCVVELFARNAAGGVSVAGAAALHVDRDMQATTDRLAGCVVPHDARSHPVAQIVRDGSSSLVARVDADWIERVSVSGAQAGCYRELGVRSLLAVPLVADGIIVGSLLCGLGDERRERPARATAYDVEDLFFTEEIGRRAGVAIVNSQRYEREHRIAIVLQEASLPRRLPDAAFLRFDAEYRPGNSEATVGGDWYDAFTLEDGRYAFTIGDVLGNGLNAAVTMTKLRQAMQTAAYLDADPNVMLDAADAMLRRHDPNSYATAVAAIYDPVTSRTIVASAGHPGPMLRSADGVVRQVQGTGMLLGLRTGHDRDIVEVPMPENTALVLFTDGLIEATRDLDEGYERLHDAISRIDPLVERRPAAALLADVLEGKSAQDDVAILVVSAVRDADRRGS